jgi:hypothetical protein
MQPKEHVGSANGRNRSTRPLLLVDIDGVISLFAPAAQEPMRTWSVEGSFHSVEGIPHFLSSTAATLLLELSQLFDLVWASGWEERANEHLPHLLGMPAQLPFLRFDRDVGGRGAHTRAHWKLHAIDSYAGSRPLAWLDDALDDACREWAERRAAPTLLVQTSPDRGLTADQAERLSRWARALESAATPAAR